MFKMHDGLISVCANLNISIQIAKKKETVAEIVGENYLDHRFQILSNILG